MTDHIARLLAEVAARRDALVALTQDLVRIETINPPGNNYREICDYLAARLGSRGFAIELLRARHGLSRIAYVDIDAHHGDGVFYAFEADPQLIFADLHEDGRHLYPGTGSPEETGKGAAVGTKLNVALPPGADTAAFEAHWPAVLAHVEAHAPEFILLQCGADSIDGDPIAHLRYAPEVHGRAARDLVALAERLGHGRVLATGGGGYHRGNLARAWNEVVAGLIG